MRQAIIIFTLFFSFSLAAQQQSHDWCGSFKTQEERALAKERILNNLRMAEIGYSQQRAIVYIPIDFCLVAKSDGSGRVSEGKVLDQLCQLNEDYAPFEMQFYLKDGTFSYVNHTGLYENHIAYQNSIMTQQRNNRALNIYVVESVDDGQGEGTTLAYYHTVRDWIVTRKASVSAGKIDLTHEVGHFFSLVHTFNGWESESYTTQNVPAPSTASDGFTPTEWQNGGNCNNAGDFICDTPPDYNWSNPCPFNLTILDPNGDVVDPDEQNYMGYFLNCGTHHFSDMQGEAMLADYNSGARNFLRLDSHPAVVEISGEVTNVSPATDEVSDYYNHVEFRWEAVSGADKYLFEISRVASFTVNPIRFVTSLTSIVLEEGLEEDKKYYWRVRPFNPHKGCEEPSSTTSFRTGTVDFTTALTTTPEAVNTFKVAPNPVTSNQFMHLTLEANTSFEGTIKMIDITGRIVKSINKNTFHQGENHISIDTNKLANGLYLLQLQTAKGQITRKVIVSR